MSNIHISKTYRQNLYNSCGESIATWLNELPALADACAARWRLSGLTPVGNLSYNMILMGCSELYGEIVLKLCIPGEEYKHEVAALVLLDSSRMCRLYDRDDACRALLLERCAGEDFNNAHLPFEQRISVAADIIASIPIKVNDEQAAHFPTYAEWLDEAFHEARLDGKADVELLRYVDEAEAIFTALEEENAYKQKYLLHGDLHHMNILTANGAYKVIDPKGVVGRADMEGSRFILNELELYSRGEAETEKDLDYILCVFDKRLHSDCKSLLRYFFVELILSLCWSVSGTMPEDEYNKAIALCRYIKKYGKCCGYLNEGS